jgi:hypothetical protein
MPAVHVHNGLNMKSFHRALAGNAHECSLSSSIGKVRGERIACVAQEIVFLSYLSSSLLPHTGATGIKRTSRTRSHNPLNLLVISFTEHIVLKNN